MDRPKDLNAMSTTAQWEMDSVWKWLDLEPNLSIAVITGTGRAFSAGADLKEWNNSMSDDADPKSRMGNAPAFKPLSRRLGKKPVIAAVNGLAMGGGCEFIVNCGMFSISTGSDMFLIARQILWLLPKMPTLGFPR